MKILSIKKIEYTGDTYNLHVNNNHNYFANNICVSNCHRYSSDETSQIVKLTANANYKYGLTGTLPEDAGATMNLIGLFSAPKRYIRASELIERGLGTPVEIVSFIIKYSNEDKMIFNSLPRGQYAKQLTFLKEHESRNKFITELTVGAAKSGNCIVLGSHTIHIKDIFMNIMKKLYPDIEVQNKNITGKKSFEFQKQYGVYFLNGEDNAETRELTRKILEEKHYIIKLKDSTELITLSENDFCYINNKDIITNIKNKETENIVFKDLIDTKELTYNGVEIESIMLRNEILISNYPVLSTGVNIKRLFSIIFASPLKAYTTITQSVGRGLRLHPDKNMFRVYDIVDDFGIRKPGGVFWKQYNERKRHSYNSEGYPITEKEYKL